MRQALSAVLFLVAVVGLSQDATLRPLPGGTTGFERVASSGSTIPVDLRRAGYVFGESGVLTPSGRERSYTAENDSRRVLLVDRERPAYALGKRELLFRLTCFLKEGRSPADIAGVMPRLLAAARKDVIDDPVVAAGLDYLAANSGTDLKPETLQAALTAYLTGYTPPSTALHTQCAGTASGCGFSDEYYGGPIVRERLDVPGAAWTIAGIRHFLDGDSAFTLEVVASVPRN